MAGYPWTGPWEADIAPGETTRQTEQYGSGTLSKSIQEIFQSLGRTLASLRTTPPAAFPRSTSKARCPSTRLLSNCR